MNSTWRNAAARTVCRSSRCTADPAAACGPLATAFDETLVVPALRGPDDGLMRELVNYRLRDKFVLASCIENLRPSAAAVLELGPDAVSL